MYIYIYIHTDLTSNDIFSIVKKEVIKKHYEETQYYLCFLCSYSVIYELKVLFMYAQCYLCAYSAIYVRLVLHCAYNAIYVRIIICVGLLSRK